MKVVNIKEESLHIFRTSWGISMKFSGMMSFIVILKVIKNQDPILSPKNTFLVKPQGKGQIDTPANCFRVKT